MHTAYTFLDTPVNPKIEHYEKFRVTSRDLDIIEYILEMKFSCIEDIHFKFFKVTKSGLQSSCLRWARERISNLVRLNYISVIKDVCHKTLYTVTTRGYFYLKNSRNQKIYSRPLISVDNRTFDHDHRVIRLRNILEEQKKASNWISERQLSEIDEVKKYLSTEFRPDAVYKDSEGRKVAFELEIARKSKERYQTKIKRYIQIMSDPNLSSVLFEKVHYVCEKQTVLDLIRSEVALYQPYFQFSLESEFLQKG